LGIEGILKDLIEDFRRAGLHFRQVLHYSNRSGVVPGGHQEQVGVTGILIDVLFDGLNLGCGQRLGESFDTSCFEDGPRIRRLSSLLKPNFPSAGLLGTDIGSRAREETILSNHKIGGAACGKGKQDKRCFRRPPARLAREPHDPGSTTYEDWPEDAKR